MSIRECEATRSSISKRMKKKKLSTADVESVVEELERVLECALDGRCSIIVTGDRRDLLKIKTFRHVEIITAKSFLEKV